MTESRQISVAVNVSRCGRLDGLALWFDLHLYDDITVTTGPQGCQQSGSNIELASCWEQAVYPIMHLEQGALCIASLLLNSRDPSVTIRPCCVILLNCICIHSSILLFYFLEFCLIVYIYSLHRVLASCLNYA